MRARKGDLVIVETTRATWHVDSPRTTATTFAVGVVASATRDGAVKTWTPAYSDASARRLHTDERVHVMPAHQIDVGKCVETARAHVWPGHSQVKDFDSLDEVRTALRPHLILA